MRPDLGLNSVLRMARRARLQLGLPGLAGVVLLALAGWGVMYAARTGTEVGRLQALTEQARSQAARLQARHVDQVDPGERLHRFELSFPEVRTATRDLRRIYLAADRSHLSLPKGEYSLNPVEGSPELQRFDVILPLKERYAPVKRFVAEVLNALPHASLVELQVERPGSAADELDSRVHFALYYRVDPS